jgi:predicted flap endonuclease-1-like 5' DNA nuclease
MSQNIAEFLPLILIGIVLLIVLVWLFLRINRKTTVVGAEDSQKRDVLDDGAERPRRNEALISSPRGVEKTLGETSATANAHGIATAGESADAEAGVSVAPTVGDPVPEPKAARDAEPAPAPAAGEGDDLSLIKGVGPKLVTMLRDLGVTRFEQIAAWGESDIERVDAQLGRFAGRIRRDQWVEQAKLLVSGDKDAFEAKFGRGA